MRTVILMCRFDLVILLSLSLHFKLLKEEYSIGFIKYQEAFVFYFSTMYFVCMHVQFSEHTVMAVYVNSERAKLEL